MSHLIHTCASVYGGSWAVCDAIADKASIRAKKAIQSKKGKFWPILFLFFLFSWIGYFDLLSVFGWLEWERLEVEFCIITTWIELNLLEFWV